MAEPDPYASLGTVETAPPAPSEDPYAAMGTVEQPQSHTWSARTSKGKTFTFQAPPDADEATIHRLVTEHGGDSNVVVAQKGQPAPPQNHSALDGLALGAWNALDNGAALLSHIPGVSALDQWAHDHLGTATVDQFNQGIDERRADNDRTGFQTAGNIAASLPIGVGSGGSAVGLLANGALQGALASNDHTGPGQGLSALEGAAGSLVGGKLLQGIGQAVAPRLSQAQEVLRNAGVQFTPGQLIGGVAKHVEDTLTHLPFVGDAITAARARGYQQFNRGAVNDALAHIGQAVPDRVETGHGAIAYAKKAFGNHYDATLARAQLLPDQQFASDVADVAKRATDGTLNAESAAQLQKTAMSVLGHRFQGANMLDGQTVKSVVSELRVRAGQASDPAYKQALSDLGSAVRSAAARSSAPDVAADLANADAGYAKYAVLRRAAATPENGVFSPAQLQTASRANDTSVGKGASATGEALLQPYAEAGRAVLPSKVGDSGTGPRTLVNSLAGSALTGGAIMSPTSAAITALGAGSASALYSPLAIRGLNTAFARQAGPAATATADILRLLAPLAGAIAAPATVEATQR